jgi:hypothetical protein
MKTRNCTKGNNSITFGTISNFAFLLTKNCLEDLFVRRVWRYQRANQNPYIEVEQTTQWPKEKVQKDKQRSIKHTYKTKDRVTRTPLKTESELKCSRRVESSCSTSDTYRVILFTNHVISHERGKDPEVLTPTYACSIGHIFISLLQYNIKLRVYASKYLFTL